MALDAVALNASWDELGKRFDAYAVNIPKTVGDTLQKALSDWGDVFYGSTDGVFSQAVLERWQSTLTKARETLEAAIASGAQAGAYSGTGKAASAGPLVVTGLADYGVPDFAVPAWWKFAVLALPAVWLMWPRGHSRGRR